MKQKTWRIIYPDKTESIMNYNPIKENRKQALEEFAGRLRKVSKANNWEVAIDDGSEDGFIIISGGEYIDEIKKDIIEEKY